MNEPNPLPPSQPAATPERLTPEREAWLRAKPAHYHVHELWPELEALRAELESKRTHQNPNDL